MKLSDRVMVWVMMAAVVFAALSVLINQSLQLLRTLGALP